MSIIEILYYRASKYYLFILAIATICITVGYILIGMYVYNSDKGNFAETNLQFHSEFKIQQNINQVSKVNHTFHLNYNIHIFYYAWYANPQIDGEYRHWNHKYLPSWRKENKKYPTGQHNPPNDIGSNYYPTLGCYSSKDPNIIESHMNMMREVGIGVVVLSWAPPSFVDSPYEMLQIFFDAAAKYGLKVALHVEPYKDRDPINLQNYLRNFLKTFGNHTALYKARREIGSKEIPLIYIYDSYLISASAWKEMFSYNGKISIRNTDIDGIYIGLLADLKHRDHIRDSGFDGFYTYFASNGFTYGSTWKNWKNLVNFAYLNKIIFIPSVGPGYIDTQVRPWNSENTKHRRHGQYYSMAWKNAMDTRAKYISITSFNEWHEGTQVEPVDPKTESHFVYLDYEPEGAYFYMNLTKHWINKFERKL